MHSHAEPSIAAPGREPLSDAGVMCAALSCAAPSVPPYYYPASPAIGAVEVGWKPVLCPNRLSGKYIRGIAATIALHRSV
jgi:hypothetical protein